MKVILFTRTNWSEPPRIRHQIARLFALNGWQVVFFQKPGFSGFMGGRSEYPEKNILVKRLFGFLHPQLKPWFMFRGISNVLDKLWLKFFLYSNPSLKKPDLIINFNYDYTFLPCIFNDVKLITFLNDDFELASKKIFREGVRQNINSLIKNSNITLSVSRVLVNRYSHLGSIKLFLPWSEQSYCYNKGNGFVYWGYIGKHIDLDLIASVAKSFPLERIHLVGPFSGVSEIDLKSYFSGLTNVHLFPSSSLDEIKNSNYRVALLPYKSSIAHVEAVTLANKSLRLMSIGLPLVVIGCPDFISHYGIWNVKTHEEFIASCESALKNSDAVQDSLKAFVDSNNGQMRWNQLSKILKDL